MVERTEKRNWWGTTSSRFTKFPPLTCSLESHARNSRTLIRIGQYITRQQDSEIEQFTLFVYLLFVQFAHHPCLPLGYQTSQCPLGQKPHPVGDTHRFSSIIMKTSTWKIKLKLWTEFSIQVLPFLYRQQRIFLVHFCFLPRTCTSQAYLVNHCQTPQ